MWDGAGLLIAAAMGMAITPLQAASFISRQTF
jgi:hypothetical protein